MLLDERGEVGFAWGVSEDGGRKVLGCEKLETWRESGKGAPGYRVLPLADQCLRRVEPWGYG